METLLLLAHTETDGSLSPITLESLTAIKELSASTGTVFVAGIIGEDTGEAASLLLGGGASRVLTVSGNDFSTPRYHSDALAAETIIKTAGAAVVLAAASSRLSRVLGGVCVKLDGRIDTQVSDIKHEGGTLSIERWYYKKRVQVELSREQRPWILTLSSGSFEKAAPATGQGEIEALTVDLGAIRTEVEGIQAPSDEEQTIRPDANLLFVAGAGWCKPQGDGQTHVSEAEEQILGFLHQTQSSLGGSKSLVDQSGEGNTVLSFMTHLNQIGQTGATPRHAKGLSTCCHGEEPHVVGWRFVNERRAINKDANCGWAQGKADVVYVGDAFDIVPKVTALLEKKGQ